MAGKRGAFIVFEGIDRAGKSTQVRRLVDNLNSRSVPATRMCFPDRTTKTGQLIDAYLRKEMELDDTAVHLLFSANRWERRQNILDTLAAGTSIVCDRYSYSGVAFSGAKPGMDLNWCAHPECGLPEPDVIIFLDMKVDDAVSRGDFGLERYEQADFQDKVRENFYKLRDAFKSRWKVVNAARSIEEVEADVSRIANEALDTCQSSEVGTLRLHQ